MKNVKLKDLNSNESYLVFVGYDYSPSGFDIGTFTVNGDFELQGNGAIVPYTKKTQVFELPICDD